AGDHMSKLFRRLRYWLNRSRFEAELQDEMEFHRNLKRQEMERSGVDTADAAAAATRSMGNILVAREDARGVWIWTWLDRLSEDGNAPGPVPLAVISGSLWRRQFGGDSSVIGKTINLNGRDFTVIGVLPAAFSGTRAFGFIPDVWIPLSMDDRIREAMKDRSND